MYLQSDPPGQAQNQPYLRVSTASRKCLQMMEVALDWVFSVLCFLAMTDSSLA